MVAKTEPTIAVLLGAVQSIKHLILSFDFFRNEDSKMDMLLQLVDEILELHKLKILSPDAKPNNKNQSPVAAQPEQSGADKESQSLATLKRAIHDINLQILALNVFPQKNRNLKHLITMLEAIIVKTKRVPVIKKQEESSTVMSDASVGNETIEANNRKDVDDNHVRSLSSADSAAKSARETPQESRPSSLEQATVSPPPLAETETPLPLPPPPDFRSTPQSFLDPPPVSSFGPGPGRRSAVSTIPVPGEVGIGLNFNYSEAAGSVPVSEAQEQSLEHTESESEVTANSNGFVVLTSESEDSSVSMNSDPTSKSNGKRSEEMTREQLLQPRKKTKLSNCKHYTEKASGKRGARLTLRAADLDSFANPDSSAVAVSDPVPVLVQHVQPVRSFHGIKMEPVSHEEMLAIQTSQAAFRLPVEPKPMAFLSKIEEVEIQLENRIKLNPRSCIDNSGSRTENSLAKLFVKASMIGSYHCDVENMFQPEIAHEQLHIYQKFSAVYLSEEGILFHVPHVNTKELVKLIFPKTEVVAITVRMRDELIQIRTGNKMARWVRQKLGMANVCQPNIDSPGSDVSVQPPSQWFDPFSEDASMKNIVLVPHSLNSETRDEMKRLFGSSFVLDEQLESV